MDETLQKLRTAYRQGNPGALLRAVLWCLTPPERTIPKWARIGLRDAIFETLVGERHRSWDQVFGRPHPKNVQLQPARFKQSMELFFEVEALHEAGAALDDALFEAVAQKISKKKQKKISYSTVKTAYFRLKKDQKNK